MLEIGGLTALFKLLHSGICILYSAIRHFKLKDYHVHFRRASNHIHLDTLRTAEYITTTHQGTNLYNELPVAIKNLESKKFKSKVSTR